MKPTNIQPTKPKQIIKQYAYASSAARFIKTYEKKYGKQKHTAINQLDENCFEAILWLK